MQVAALTYPAIDPVLLRVGPFQVHWYGVAYLLGFVAAAWILHATAKRWSLVITADDTLTILLYAVVGVMLGGRLGYVLFYGGSYYLQHPLEVFSVWDGGMSFHGGLVGILAAGVLAARSLKMPLLTLYDLGAIGAPVGFGLGRVANFINGELWGRTTTVPWGMVFPGAGPLPRHPSQLYEAFLEGVVLLAVMVVLSRRLPARPRGELVGWLLALYAVFRIAVEFVRQPDVQIGFIAGGVTLGQLLSVPMLVVGVWLILRARKRRDPQRGPSTGDSNR